MSYAATLKDNLKTISDFESIVGAKSYKDLTLNQVKEVISSDNKDIIKEIFSDEGGDYRYICSDDKLKDKILNLKSESVIDEYLSIIKERLFAKKVITTYSEDIFIEGVSNFRTKTCKLAFNYGIDKKVYDDEDKMKYCLKVFARHENFSNKDEQFMDIMHFAIENEIGALTFTELKAAYKEEYSEDLIKYLKLRAKCPMYCGIDDLLRNKNIKERYDYILKLGEILEVDYFVRTFMLFENENFTNKEIGTLLYKINQYGKDDFIKKVYNSNKYDDPNEYNSYCEMLRYIYPNYTMDKNNKSVEAFYHYVLKMGKKKFFNMIKENKYKIDCPSEIRNEHVYKLLNLNTLTIEQVRKMEDVIITANRDSMLKMLYDKGLRNISFNELEMLLTLGFDKFEIYSKIIDLKPDDRIRLIKDLPSIKYEEGNVEEIDEKIAKLIREKSLSIRIDEVKKNITFDKSVKLLKEDWLNFFLIEDMDNVKSQVKNNLDVLFIVMHHKEIRKCKCEDFEDIKREVYINSKEYKSFIDEIDASRDFINKYDEAIYRFFITGMMKVFLTYKRSLKNESQKENLAKITKAELSDKLKDIKFYPGDLAKEIGYKINKEREDKWKENIKISNNKYEIKEAYDYDTIIKIGEEPVNTCMSYKSGAYNYCLLSNFDANKKIIVVKNKNNQICARAVFRLTKITIANNIGEVKNDSLEFRDVENMKGKVTPSNKNEELVLFLEKCYTFLDDSENIELEMIKLAYEKSKIMDVRLMIANHYKECKGVNSYKEDKQFKSKSYIYISKSKNGYQYMDSFAGMTTNNESKYVKCDGYTVFLQDNMKKGIYEYLNN